MKRAIRGASRIAILAGLAGFAPAFAQEISQNQTIETTAQGPQQSSAQGVDQTTQPDQTGQVAPGERVVVTGSLIAGASEDAPLAVDVYDAEVLRERGSPNATEFVRSLAQSSETAGEFNIDGGVLTAGIADINLRGLGANRTLTLLNGRRTSENTNNLPMNALQAVEVLKEGAAVTYGAGAVAGVVNFVTRRDVDGLELDIEHKIIDGSDGDTTVNALFGWVGDQSNILFSASYAKQSRLPFTARDYGTYPYKVNPIQYTTFNTNPGEFYQTPFFNTLQDFDEASCNASGAQFLNLVTAGGAADPTCAFAYTKFFDFVPEQDTYRIYSEFNADITDSMEFHVEAGYTKIDVPIVRGSPTLPPTGSHRGVIPTAGFASVPAGQFAVPYSNAGVRNPYIDLFFDQVQTRAGQDPDATPNPSIGSLYTGVLWRPFGNGGNPAFGDYDANWQYTKRDFFNTAMSLKGEFTPDTFFGSILSGISYDHAVTANIQYVETEWYDVITSRLQDALRGYGGPNCAAVDDTPTNFTSLTTYNATVGIQDASIAPGSNGCEWFNPFASAFPMDPIGGTANPNYGGPAFENSTALAQWLHGSTGAESTTTNLVFDSVFSGTIPAIELPGGEVGWAAGGQWRQSDFRSHPFDQPDELTAIGNQLCPWPDVNPGDTAGGTVVCAIDEPGPFWSLGSNVDDDISNDQQIYAYFGELQLPVLDNLNFQVGLRREVFGDIEGDIYKVAGKWDVTPEFGVRGNYSTNFAPPGANLVPGQVNRGTTYNSRVTTFLPTASTTTAGITPEEGTNYGFGLIWAPQFGDNSLRVSVDYFNIEVLGQITTTSLTTLLNGVVPTEDFESNGVAVSQVGGGRNITTAFVDCDSPLIVFVNITGTCTPGVTVGSEVTSFNLFQLNGPGQITDGIDYSVDYSRPLGEGFLTAGLSATQVLSYDTEGYSLQSVQFETGGDRLGFSNDSRFGQFSSEWRGNLFVGYSIGDHNFRAQLNYISGVKDDDYLATQADGSLALECPSTATFEDPMSVSCFGVFPEDYSDFDIHYRYTPSFWEDSEFRISVLNVADEDPMAEQQRVSYYERVGNARGRQIELGFSKKF